LIVGSSEFEKINFSESHLLGDIVFNLFKQKTKKIKHPENFDNITQPMLSDAGCKTWKEFAKKSKMCRIKKESKNDYRINYLTITDSKGGYIGGPPSKTVPASSSSEDLTKYCLEIFNDIQ
jgi:hypothetical protein